MRRFTRFGTLFVVLTLGACSFEEADVFAPWPLDSGVELVDADMTYAADISTANDAADLLAAGDYLQPVDFASVDFAMLDLLNVDLASMCRVNGVRDDAETDIDCGGPVCSTCVAGKSCFAPADCQSNSCGMGRCGPWIQLVNNQLHILRTIVYNGQPGAPEQLQKGATKQFVDQQLQLVAFSRFDNNVESDADGTEVMCTSDSMLVAYAADKIAIGGLPLYACKHK